MFRTQDNVDAAKPTSLVSLLTSRAVEHPGAGYAFLCDGESVGAELTYAELDRRARAIAAWLRELGSRGERGGYAGTASAPA